MRWSCVSAGIPRSVRGTRSASSPALSPSPLPADDGEIRFHARGLRSDAGHVLCFLHASAASWPDGLLRWTRAGVHDREATCRFAGIAPGTYAIAAFHDENSDGALQRILGVLPREGVGSSAAVNTRGRTFDDAAFGYEGGVREVDGSFRYPLLS